MSVADRDARRAQIQADVDHMRTLILHHADSKKDHMPPVKATSSGALTYPFDIAPEYASHIQQCVVLQCGASTVLQTHGAAVHSV